MSTKLVLEAARDRIADPKQWCQSAMDDGFGRVCALGAIESVHGSWEHHGAVGALASLIDQEQLRPDMPYRVIDMSGLHGDASRIVSYNNTNPHGCVIALFDAAIEAEHSSI